MLTVSELLSDLDVRLLTGESATDVPVRWVHISEIEDPTPWLSGGELLLTTGMQLYTEERQRAFVDRLAHAQPPLVRTKGTAVFLNRGKETTPLAMRANCEHNHVLHEHVIIMAIDTLPVPRVPESERTETDDLGYGDDGIIHLTAHFGYMEAPDVLGVLRLLDPSQTEGQIDVDDASYFLSDLELTMGTAKNMAQWRKHLFIATSHITADAANYFGLPPDRTVVMGSRIEI